MKSFLDRFRRKGEPEPPRKAETTDEIAKEAIQSGYAPTLQRRAAAKTEPSNEGTEPARPAPSAAPQARESPPPARRDEVVSFELADFLPRIPEQLLGKGPFDPKLPLTFELGELSTRIARGQTTLSLAEVYRRVPHVFRGEIRESDNIEIRFPWQKLLELVKAADSSKPGTGLSETAAEALAQKLRSRKRNIGPGGIDKTAPGTPRFPPGHRQPSWFSRSPAPATAASAPAAKSDPEPVAAPTQSPATPPVEASAPALAPRVAPAAVEPPAGSISFGPVSADVTPEQPPAEAEAAGRPPAESEGAEQQFATLAHERQVFAAQRDQALGELSRLLQEVDEHQSEAVLQKSLVEKSRQLATEAGAERDALRQQLDEQAAALEQRSRELRELEKTVEQLEAGATGKTTLEVQLGEERSIAEQRAREVESLRVEIGQLKQGAASDLAALREERDVLLQQKTHLSQQIAQFQKSANISSEAITTEGERSRRDYQRQVEELQRRILALESNQKESAHELGREREARIKAERAASAADRSRGEATALVESIRGEMRREAEAVNRKRDAEFARLQKESHEQIEAVTDAQRKAVSERDELAAEVAALRKTAQEGGAAAAGAVDMGWESRAVASLESDIESYRARIKTLLKERETLTKDKEQLPGSGADAVALAELKVANEKLAADLAAARDERAGLAAQLQEMNERRARAESGSSITLAAHQERANAELSHAEGQLTALRHQHETLAREHASALARGDDLKAQLAAGLEGKTPVAEIEELRAQTEALRAETARLQAALADATREIETVRKAVADENEAALQEVREQLAAERETARAEAGKLQTELERVRATAGAEREAAVQAARGEFEAEIKKTSRGSTKQRALVAERDALAAELKLTRKDFEEQLAALQRDLDGARTSDLAAGTELAAARSEAASLQAARSAAEQKVASLIRERDESREQLEATGKKLREAAAQLSANEEELAKTVREHERACAKFNAEKEKAVGAALGEKTRSVSAAEKERDELAAALDAEQTRARDATAAQGKEFAAKTAALIEERDLARHESTAVAQRLAAMALEADEKLGTAQALLEARIREKEALSEELEAARESFNSQSAVFAREVKTLSKQRDEALTALDTARANLQEKAAALARERVTIESTVEDVKHRTDREIARLRRERDVLVRQRDDSRTRITRMVEEQNKLLEELAAQAGRVPLNPSDVSPELAPAREANVIDISEADVVKDVASDDLISSGVRPPRVRPVPIPPPNVRIL